jgi:hypothetical protein
VKSFSHKKYSKTEIKIEIQDAGVLNRFKAISSKARHIHSYEERQEAARQTSSMGRKSE